MHEQGIIKSLIDFLITKGKEKGYERITEVTINICNTSDLNYNNLEEMFREFSKETICENSKLIIKESKGGLDLYLEEFTGI